MLIGNWEFQPKIIPSLATLLVLPILFSLGFWQMDRAEQKSAAYADYQARINQAPLDMDAMKALVSNPENLLWRSVKFAGRFSGTHYLLDNRVHRGRAGYHVYTPLIPDGGGKRLLINRGWIPAGLYRDRPPDIDTPAARLELSGKVRPIPERGVILGEETVDSLSLEIIRMQYIDFDFINRFSEAEFYPFVIRLASDSPGGFVRAWPAPGSGREKHLGYAFQWFALSATLVTIYLLLNTRRRRTGH